MLRVPKLSQPDPVTCLPTCVLSVLEYQGQSVNFEEVLEACDLDPLGAVDDIALRGLREAGWDIEEWRELTMERIAAAFEDDRPVIVTLPPRERSDREIFHAVVVCDIDADHMTVMDPAIGDFVRIPIAEAEAILEVARTSFRISGRVVEALSALD